MIVVVDFYGAWVECWDFLVVGKYVLHMVANYERVVDSFFESVVFVIIGFNFNSDGVSH